MVKLHWIGVAAFLLFALFSVPSVLANPVPVTECGVLNQSDSVYIVTEHIFSTGSGTECILIMGNNITLTSEGLKTITGPANPTIPGIRIEYSTNVFVSNLSVGSFTHGIMVLSSSELSIFGVISSDNTYGFNLVNVSNSYLRVYAFGNLPSSRAQFGLHMTDSNNNVFENLFLVGNKETNLLMTNSDSNQFSDISVYNSNTGIAIAGGESNSFERVYVFDINGTGIEMYGGAQFNEFNNLTLNLTRDDGLKMILVSNNTLSNCVFSQNGGYSLSLTRSMENTVSDCSFSDSDGFFVGFESLYNVIRDVNIMGAGMTVYFDASDNLFDGVSVMNSNISGLFVHNSHRNNFSNLVINGSAKSAVVINGSSSGNVFAQVVLDNILPGYYDFEQVSSTDTSLIDSSIAGYLVLDSNFSFVKNGTGQIRMIDLVSAQGASLSDVFQFSSNLLVFQGNESFSNKSAEVTLYGLPTGRINHAILRNGVVCDTSICTAVSIDGATAVFLVNEAGNYSIRSEDAPAPSTNSGGGGGGGGGSRSTVTRTNNTVTPLSNTNSTPSTNNTIDGDVALTGNAAGQGLGKKSLWVIVIVVVALAIASAAVFYVRKMKASGNSAPHLQK